MSPPCPGHVLQGAGGHKGRHQGANAAAVRGVLAQPPGRHRHAVMGPSGAGKTTFLNVTAGKIVGGEVSGDVYFDECRRTPIGVIRFGLSLRSARTVLENTILTTVLTAAVTVLTTAPTIQ